MFAAGALIVLFSGRTIISSMYDDAGVARQVATFRNKLRAGGEAAAKPDRAALSDMAALRDELHERLQAAIDDLHYELPEEFSVGPGQSPDLAYIEIVRREQDALVKGAAFIGKSVPSNLGLPELNPTGLEDVLRSLRTLHVVHQVVAAALAADVDAVDEIRVPPLSRRSRAESGFVRAHRVEFELRGRPAAVRAALEGIAGSRPYLALDEVHLEQADADGERVLCRFAAVALSLDPEQIGAGS